jgi:hypothetical protein
VIKCITWTSIILCIILTDNRILLRIKKCHQLALAASQLKSYQVFFLWQKCVYLHRLFFSFEILSFRVLFSAEMENYANSKLTNMVILYKREEILHVQ